MTPTLSLLVGCAVALLLAFVWAIACTEIAEQYEAENRRLKAALRIATGDYEITPDAAERIRGDLFPRPMGACPSTTRDVEHLRLAREARRHHALDPRHHRVAIELPDAVCDSEAATKVLMLTVGGWEKPE